jgi:capsid protein
MELIESKSPNGTYTTHMIEEGKAVAAAYDMPYEYLMGIFTAGSYNAQKGARLFFKDTCTRRAEHRNQWMLQRVWNWRIAKAIKAKELPPAPQVTRSNGYIRSLWDRVEWALPRFEDIDLGRNVSAKSAAWAAGQQSLRDQRDNPYQILMDKAEDIQKADEIAQRINRTLKTGQITWQHILNAGVPGMTVPQPDADDEADKSDEKDDEDEK